MVIAFRDQHCKRATDSRATDRKHSPRVPRHPRINSTPDVGATRSHTPQQISRLTVVPALDASVAHIECPSPTPSRHVPEHRTMTEFAETAPFYAA